MRPVLLTGFEPFAGQRVNPSELAVRALAGRTIAIQSTSPKSIAALVGRITAANPARMPNSAQEDGSESRAIFGAICGLQAAE